jgi:hypothetical protein
MSLAECPLPLDSGHKEYSTMADIALANNYFEKIKCGGSFGGNW